MVVLDHHASVIMEYIDFGSKLHKKGKKVLTVGSLSLPLLNAVSDDMFKISRSMEQRTTTNEDRSMLAWLRAHAETANVKA